MLNTFIPREERTIYLPRSVVRAHDIPQGNPFGGVAYERREDPITAAFAAIGTSAFGVAELAIVAGTLSVGATVIGAVTGSKALMNIGKVLGVVGAVAGVVNIATGLTSAAAGSVEGAIGAVDPAGIDTLALSGSESAGSVIPELGGNAEGLIGTATDTVTGAASTAVDGGIQSVSQGGLISPVAQSTIPASSANPAFSQIGNASAAPNLSSANVAANTATQATAPGAPLVEAPTPTGAYSPDPGIKSIGAPVNKAALQINNASTGWLDKLFNSPYAPMAAMQGVGSAVNAVGGYLTNQDQLAYAEKLRQEQINRSSAAGRLYV